MKKSLLLLLICNSAFAFSQNKKQPYLLIGTYTNGKSEGVYVYQFNTLTADNNFISVVKASNPSFLAISPNKKLVYVVNENADSTINPIGGTVSAFSFNKANGTLSFINQQPSGGKHPCYISIDKTGKWVFAGNYSSGTVSLFHVNSNGSVSTATQIIQQEGTGPNKERQEASHVHATVLSDDNKFLFVPDLGADKIVTYTFDNKKGCIKELFRVASPPGNGPRHLECSPNNKFAYLMEELTGTVVCYDLKNGKLVFKQRISALADTFKGNIGSADIHVSPDGKFLYCSNRGESNSISIFSINQQDGKLTLIGEQPTLGVKPRNFNFDPTGNFLLVANQETNNIVIFKRDIKTGLLKDTGKRIDVPNPVCLKWITQ
jgi:6-phosphogluconolactonase